MGKNILKAIGIFGLITASLLSYAKTYGPTKSTDNLWNIARLLKPQQSSISLEQTMVALYNANPKAFNYKNINSLKDGYHLYLPPLGTIKEISAKKAAQIIDQQNAAWQKNHLVDGKNLNVISLQRLVAKSEAELATTLKDELTDIKKSVQTLEQHTDQQTMVLRNDNQNLQSRVINLEQKLTTTEQKIDSYQKAQKTIRARLNNNFFIRLGDYLEKLRYKSGLSHAPFISLLAMLGIAILLLLILISQMCFGFKKRSEKSISMQFPRENSGAQEYDFLADKEGISTKLDLARVYIDIGDKKNAEILLKEIIEKGNAEQKDGAKTMLKTSVLEVK